MQAGHEPKAASLSEDRSFFLTQASSRRNGSPSSTEPTSTANWDVSSAGELSLARVLGEGRFAEFLKDPGAYLSNRVDMM